MDILENAELKMISSLENYENRLTTIRAGRANPKLIEKITVDYYGTQNVPSRNRKI